MRLLSLRALFLLGFVIVMPVLALPPVARRIDELLYGPPPTEFARPPAAAPLQEQLTAPQPAGPIAPARFDEASPAATVAASSFASPINPPALAPAPQFALPSPPPKGTANPAPETRIDERTMTRLQQIRQRLEQLGAEYVVVDEDAGRFRFHCRMLIDERSRFTRPFEASSFDAIAAGEQVLRDVESWRTAGSAP